MRRWMPSGVAESSATALESSEVEESGWMRLRKTLFIDDGVTAAVASLGLVLLFLRTGESSSSSGDDSEEDTSRVKYGSLRGVEDGIPLIKNRGTEVDSVVAGLQAGVKKYPLCSMLLRTSRTRITSSIAGVKIELVSRSIGLHERLSNLFF